MVVDVDDPDGLFSQFVRLGFGDEITLNSRNFPTFLKTWRALRNEELYEFLFHKFEDEMSTRDVIN
jgi:hypothetical protein